MADTNPGIYPGTTGRTRMPSGPRKLGDLSLLELVESVDREIGGFIALIEECKGSYRPDDFERFRDAYIASIRVRLVVAKSKIDAIAKAVGA